MLPLLLLLLPRSAVAADNQKETTYTLKSIESCPDEGYYFENDSAPYELKPGSCQLCFCRGKGDAVCWERPASECITKNHINIDKSEKRIRRSPLTNLALKYMAKSGFSKQPTYNCMPLGSTLSAGCPPNDWCLGCTICDCEVSGHWNCHILSFCSDKKATKHIQSQNNNLKRRAVRIHPKVDNHLNATKVHKYARKLKVNPKCNSSQPWCHELTLSKRNSYLPKHDDKAVVFEKDLVGRKSTEIQGVRVKKILNENNNNVRLAQKVHRAIVAVHKIINMNERSSTNSTKFIKVIKKRSMFHHENNEPDYMSSHIYKISSPRRFKKKILFNKISDESNENKRTKRNVDILNDRGNRTETEQSTSKLYNEYINDILINKTQKLFETPLKLNEHQYYQYNVITDEKSGAEDINGLKVKQLSYNFLYGNKSVNLQKRVSHNLDDTKLYSTSNVLNLSMSHYLKDKKQDIKTINITDIKYFTLAPNMNSSLNYNELKLQKNHTQGRPLKHIAVNDISMNESRENEDLNLINNMLNSKGILQHVIKKKSKTILPNKNTTDNLNFIMNLKRLFNKIFVTNKNNRNKLKVLDKQNLLDTFCGKNDTCKVHPRDEIKLQIKINELNGEMYKIIETIKIIKKLLQTIIKNNSAIDDTNLKTKLGNSMKGIFSDQKNQSIVENQQLQLYYIKEAIKTFVRSIGKFSYILQDILYMLTDKANTQHTNKKSPNRPLRCAGSNGKSKMNTKNLTPEQRFKKLKIVLMNYNLLQNTFIKRIYDMLTKLEVNLTNADKKKRYKKPDKADLKDIHKSLAVEKYTKNIIDNLRKLKNLALKLSSTGHRRKRSTMGDDDAIEYLLMLMEYLLKQNYPLDAAPVNDGIDLLIDAIKHAPDIKPIRKKVLDNPTITTTVTRTSQRATTEIISYTKNPYAVAAPVKVNNYTSQLNNNQANTISKTAYEGNNNIDDFHKLLHNSKKIKNSFRLSNFNSILKNAKFKAMTTTTPNIITTSPLVQYDFFKYNSPDTADVDKYVKIDDTIGKHDKNEVDDNFKSYLNDNDRSNQAELDDYPPNLGRVVTDSSAKVHVYVPTRTPPMQTTTTRKFHHMIRQKFTTETTLHKSMYSKPKFNWADYDQGGESGKKSERKTLSKPELDFVDLKNQILRVFNKNDVSTISKETMDDEEKKRIDKLLPDIFLKKINSIHSSELGTPKSDAESESKDVEVEDIYVNDMFPSYF